MVTGAKTQTFGLTKMTQCNKGNGAKAKSSSFKKLTKAKMQSKREKGLCFQYDEKFSRDIIAGITNYRSDGF